MKLRIWAFRTGNRARAGPPGPYYEPRYGMEGSTTTAGYFALSARVYLIDRYSPRSPPSQNNKRFRRWPYKFRPAGHSEGVLSTTLPASLWPTDYGPLPSTDHFQLTRHHHQEESIPTERHHTRGPNIPMESLVIKVWFVASSNVHVRMAVTRPVGWIGFALATFGIRKE